MRQVVLLLSLLSLGSCGGDPAGPAPSSTTATDVAETRPAEDVAKETSHRMKQASASAPADAYVEKQEDDADGEADDAQDAVEVLHEYYRAISAGDFERAYRSWGSSGPPGQSLESFRAGFADTTSVEVNSGEPSRVEGAAGSRYVRVPVTVTARTKNGATQHFEGTYTLRRSVVDGASASERRWHLYRATIREVSGASP